jgi:hypothetical protein
MNIGVTGHQKLSGKGSEEWLKNEMSKELCNINGVGIAFSSLAIGADQLFAKTAISKKIDLVAIIPCSRYEETFQEAAKASYFELLLKCKLIETLDFPEPSEVAFLSAGKQVVDKSDVLFAIWDGQHAKGLGGTGDIVEYALSLNKKVIHLNHILKKTTIYN